jgi:glycolate oxidase iron-sulfur subunit
MAVSPAVPQEFAVLYEEVVTCGKCGFCQPTCPVYRATSKEGYVARGKNALFRNIIEGQMPLTREAKEVFANCLLCRACTENCFTGVRTDQVVISFRHAFSDRFGRGFLQRAAFRYLLPRPVLMRTLVRMLWALRWTRLPDVLRRAGVVRLINPKLDRALQLRLGTPGRLLRERLRRRKPVPADTKTRQLHVGYWMSCGYNYVLPDVGEATVSVLERLGMTVEVLDNCCCGLAAYGYGDREAAARLARQNLERLGDLGRFDAIVSDCGSCSGHLKEYPDVLKQAAISAGGFDNPDLIAAAERLRGKMRSFSEYVIEVGGPEILAAAAQGTAARVAVAAQPVGAQPAALAAAQPTADIRVTYHDPCHLGRRYQKIVDQPRSILRSLPGVTVVELTESDSCCGAAGTYGVTHPDVSAAIIDRKMGFLDKTGASVIATECPSCMLQLGYGVRRAELAVEVVSVSQLCDRLPR